MGKTALSEELYRVARAEGWRAAWATCAEGAVRPGFWPWRRLLSGLKGSDHPIGVEPGDPAARVELFDVIVETLADASVDAPVLLVIDDMHWADATSVAMLMHAAATVRQGRVCILVNYRPEDARPGTAFGEALAGLRRTATELWLSPLGAKDVAALVAGLDAGALAEVSGERLASLTGGNPLFVTELIRVLPSGWVGDADALPAPPSVVSLVAQRLRAVRWRRR